MTGWPGRVDQAARQAKRAVFAGTRRMVKIARERGRTTAEYLRGRAGRRWARVQHDASRSARPLVQRTSRWRRIVRERTMNARVAAMNLTRKAARRVWGWRAPVVRVGKRGGKVVEQLQTYGGEWALEREIAKAVSGSEPILLGPWTSEVGFEALYWVAFTRWVKAYYQLKPDRLAVMSRGGVGSWYADITPRYFEIFDRVTPGEFARRNAERMIDARTNKQVAIGPLEAELIESVRRELGVPRLRVLHPSLMYRLFRRFWGGHRPIGFVEAHTNFARIQPPAADLRAMGLPREYIAVKFYAAQSLPDTPDHRRMVARIVDGLAERYPVVMLDTGLAVDEHGDYAVARGARVISAREFMRPSDNLGIQTQLIAGARGFAGTCGSIAWMAPMLGVDTLAVMADAKFLHAHLHAARWVYKRLEAGRFSVLDLGALPAFGLTVGGGSDSAERVAFGLKTGTSS